MKKSPKIVKLDINEEDNFSGVDSIALVENPAIELNWAYFSNQKFQSYTDYPDAVSNNAKRGIELNEKVNNNCATQVGKVRAQQLANKEAISVETIKRMYSYLSRAETYYDESDTEACGTISYLLWGGLAGKRWSESKLKELGLFEGAIDVSTLPNYVNQPSGSLIVKDIYQSMEIDVFGYKTKYFYICPGAISTFQDLTSLELDEDVVGMVRSAAQIADNVFLIEKNAIERGITSKQELDEAILLVDDFQDLIREIEELVGRTYNTSYMDNHIITIRSYLKDVFVENAGGFSVGDYVSWTFAGRGDDADRGRGQIIDLRVSGEVNVPETDVTLTATEEEPVALIRTRSGKVVGQYTRNLRKIQKPEGFVKPSVGETQDDFLGRCIPYVINEGKDQDQAAAVCYSYWREGFDGKMEDYFRELFDFLGYVDDLPVYSTPEEAEEVAEIAGCKGYHEHQLGDLVVYMPCESHDDSWDSLLAELYNEFQKSTKRSWDELSNDQKDSLLQYLDKVAVDAPDSKDRFNNVKTSDIKSAGRNFGESFLDTPSTKIRYQYEGPVDSRNRDFCRILMTRYTQQGKVFRKEDINNMSFAGVNTGFGPNGINEYNIFLYRGGNNCRHEWKTVAYTIGSDGDWMNSTKEVSSIAELQSIIAPRNPQSELGVIEGPLGIGTQFSKQHFTDQQIVAGPFMIPNKLIYRSDEDDDEYYVYFSDDTIKKIAYKYMQNKYTDSTNIEHLSALQLNDVFVVESWLVEDPKRDKSLIYSGGEEYPKGTWYGLMKVKNKGVWENYVKTGLVKGFSVEGFFIDELLNKTKV